jgi:hypothetical protein
MANSMLAAIHAAATADVADDDTSAAEQAATKEKTMTKEVGVPQADHEAAVATARRDGHAAGAAEATTRLAAILGAEGIKGDAARMDAALDLAVKSPGMKAEEVTGFITANVPASKPAGTDAAAYEAERLAGLAKPQGQQKKAGDGKTNWSDFRGKRKAG